MKVSYIGNEIFENNKEVKPSLFARRLLTINNCKSRITIVPMGEKNLVVEYKLSKTIQKEPALYKKIPELPVPKKEFNKKIFQPTLLAVSNDFVGKANFQPLGDSGIFYYSDINLVSTLELGEEFAHLFIIPSAMAEPVALTSTNNDLSRIFGGEVYTPLPFVSLCTT